MGELSGGLLQVEIRREAQTHASALQSDALIIDNAGQLCRKLSWCRYH